MELQLRSCWLLSLPLALLAASLATGCCGTSSESDNTRRDEVLERFFTPEAVSVLNDVPLTYGHVGSTLGFSVGDDLGSELISAATGNGCGRQVIIAPAMSFVADDIELSGTVEVDDWVILHEYVHQADYSGLILRDVFREAYQQLRRDPPYQPTFRTS